MQLLTFSTTDHILASYHEREIKKLGISKQNKKIFQKLKSKSIRQTNLR